MEVKNGKCKWAPEDLLGSWIKCTNEEAEKLLKYFKMPVGITVDGKAYYNISPDRQSYAISTLSDNKIRCWFAFYTIKFPETEQNKKIIGYKCPVDLFNGRVKAGMIFTSYNDIDLYASKGSDFQKGYFTLPKEIVETWEPVYEQTMKYAKNTALLTKDGRVCGNAIITDYLNDSYVITTDYGGTRTFSEQKVENQWYIGSVKNIGNHKHAVKIK